MNTVEPPENTKGHEVRDFYTAEGIITIIMDVPVGDDGVIHLRDVDFQKRVLVDTKDPEEIIRWEGAWLTPGPSEWNVYGVSVDDYFHIGTGGTAPYVRGFGS